MRFSIPSSAASFLTYSFQASPLSRRTMLFIAASASINVESTTAALPLKSFFVWAIRRTYANTCS